MSSIGNTAKLEESLGGFTTVAGLDDSFLLDNMDEYPGKLPYDISEPEIIPDFSDTENSLDSSENISDSPHEESVWDVFNTDQSDFQQDKNSNKTPEDEEKPENSESEIFSNLDIPSFREEFDTKIEETVADKNPMNIDSFLDEFRIESDKKETEELESQLENLNINDFSEKISSVENLDINLDDSLGNLGDMLPQESNSDLNLDNFNFKEDDINEELEDKEKSKKENLFESLNLGSVIQSDIIPDNISDNFSDIKSEENSDIISEINMDELGDDLLKLIQGDLDKTKHRKERNIVEPIILTEDEIKEKISAFKPVEENNKTELIDLADIEAEHPSSYILQAKEQKKKSENLEEIKWDDTTDLKSERSKSKKIKSEKNKPIKSPRKLNKKYVYLSLLVLLLCLGSAGVWTFLVDYNGWDMIFPQKPEDILVQSDSNKSEIKKIDTNIAEIKKDTNSHKETQIEATIEEKKPEIIKETKEIKEIKVTKVETTPVPVKITERKIEKKLEKKPDKIITEKKSYQKKSDLAEKKYKNKEVYKEKYSKFHKNNKIYKTPKSWAHTSKPKSTVNNKTNKNKSEDLSETKEITPEIEKKEQPKTSVKTTLSDQEKSLYTIEIYKSPSYDDAVEYIQNLKKRNLINLLIKTQKIKDITWYKVRFGSFTNLTDAKNEAVRLGLNSASIDRVR